MIEVIKAEEKHVTAVGKLRWDRWCTTRIVAKNQVAYSFWNKQGFKMYQHTLYSEI